MKRYDHERVLKLLDQAQEDWHSQGRVTRKTFTALQPLLPLRMGDRIYADLINYQNPRSTDKAVAFVGDLKGWKAVRAWAEAGKAKAPEDHRKFLERVGLPPHLVDRLGGRRGIL